MLEQLKDAYGDDMYFVYRHFPLSGIHNKAQLAAVAAESAGLQDAFWEYHNLLFERQDQWATLSVDDARQVFIDYAKELKLDVDKFTAGLNDEALQAKVQEAEQVAQQAGLPGTPTVFVNGYNFPNRQLPLSPDGIGFFLNIIRLVENQYQSPEQVIDPGKTYQATISTEKGDVVIDLFNDTAPLNVNSFAFLAGQGWYNNVTFHRVLAGFMAQAGDPTGLGVGWPGYRCTDEVAESRSFDKPGMVAMANSGPNTNGAQFFITFGPAPHLDEDFTIIGEVVSGMDVVDSLTPRDPDKNPSFSGDKILSVTIAEK